MNVLIKATVERSKDIFVGVEKVIGDIIPYYDGSTIVIPRGYSQELETGGTQLRQNIIVDEIPDDYAKISWDGSVLRFGDK